MWVALTLISFMLVGALAPPAHAKRVALVVGINKYDNLPRERQLVKAVNDARAVEVALKSVGFEVIKAEDVGRSAFNLAWQQLLNKLGPGDEVTVFFSGHGVEIEGGNYLIPRDVPAVGTGEVRRLKNESLSFDEMRRDLAAQGPRITVFILDACRDNPFADTRGRSIGGAKGLVPVQAEQGTFIMFAAGARESALDRLDDKDGDPNSVYTRKLLPLLKEPGLRLPDLAQRVRGEVRQLASTVGHRQSPAYYDEGADDVCLAGCAPPAAVAPAQISEAERAWAAAKDTTSIAVLEDFIARYKGSFYTGLARARIEELKKQQVATAAPSMQPEAETAGVALLVRACDIVAGAPGDLRRPSDISAIPFARLDVRAANAPCQAAYEASPKNPRIMFELGRILDKEQREDTRARVLYEAAAAQGYAAAQVNLGTFHEQGRGGLAKDDKEAAQLYKLAADQGDSGGQNNLAVYYEQGRGGLPKDEHEAARLFKLAADQGIPEPQFHLGAYYAEGRGGLPKDEHEAARLFKLAADQGYALARDRLKQINKQR
jgi:hypothetical protein